MCACSFIFLIKKKKILYAYKSDKEQIFLTPDSVMSRYRGWFDPCPHPRPSDYDGLQEDWGEKAFVNPPWGHIRPWVKKASIERGRGCSVHMLLPAKSATRVFQDLIFPNGEVEWLRGRIPYHRLREGKTVSLDSCLVKFSARERSGRGTFGGALQVL